MHQHTSLPQFLLLILISFSSIFYTSAHYTVIEPATGVTCKAGERVKIRCTLSGSSEDTVDVILVHGKPENLQFVFNVCENIKASDGECEYSVDGQIKSGVDYSVTIGKDPAEYGYSSYCKYGTKTMEFAFLL